MDCINGTTIPMIPIFVGLLLSIRKVFEITDCFKTLHQLKHMDGGKRICVWNGTTRSFFHSIQYFRVSFVHHVLTQKRDNLLSNLNSRSYEYETFCMTALVRKSVTGKDEMNSRIT